MNGVNERTLRKKKTKKHTFTLKCQKKAPWPISASDNEACDRKVIKGKKNLELCVACVALMFRILWGYLGQENILFLFQTLINILLFCINSQVLLFFSIIWPVDKTLSVRRPTNMNITSMSACRFFKRSVFLFPGSVIPTLCEQSCPSSSSSFWSISPLH